MADGVALEWMAHEMRGSYAVFEDDAITVWCAGLVAFSSGDFITSDVLEIAKMAVSKTLDYNNLFGFFKIVVFDKATEETLYFCDNSGSARFFYDKDAGVIADTLPLCVTLLSQKVRPCYEAIYQYLSIGRTIDNETIVDGVLMTSCDCIYWLKNGIIYEETKGLRAYSELDPSFSLEKLMRILTHAMDGELVSAVATGGTDSRTILAHLMSLGFLPRLITTGRIEDDDVRIAKNIADHLGLKLSIYDPNDKEPDWIKKGFDFCNGVYDVVLSYRHLRKAQLSLQQGSSFEFGGVGGEFYKNSYCRPFRFRRIFRKTTADSILRNTIGRALVGKGWYGDRVIAVERRVYDNLLGIMSKHMEKGFLRNYNVFATLMLRGGFCNISGNILPYCTKIDPLMDRNLIASVCWRNPLSLSMARWQRNEIHKYCPALSRIETDEGLTCSTNQKALLLESLKKLRSYVQLGLGRVKRVVFRTPRRERSCWDKDYIEARESLEYENSVRVCKKLGIISTDVAPESLPLHQVGFILMFGMFFELYGDVRVR